MNWMVEHLRANAKRHRERAARHVAEGRPEYAVGSMLKARRCEQRAREIDYRGSSVSVFDDLVRRGTPPGVARLLAKRLATASKHASEHMARMLLGDAPSGGLARVAPTSV